MQQIESNKKDMHILYIFRVVFSASELFGKLFSPKHTFSKPWVRLGKKKEVEERKESTNVHTRLFLLFNSCT